MTMSARIILVRHAQPIVTPGQPAQAWPLSPTALKDVDLLVPPVRTRCVDAVVASPETKALETGRILAEALDLPLSTDPDICEQGGGRVPWIGREEAFRDAVALHFTRPSEQVLGTESSQEAVARFARAVDRARATCRFPVLVTHGRVLSVYVARETRVEPMAIWSTLQMPDALEIDLDTGMWCRVGEEEQS